MAKITKQELELIINTAQSAPLQNMQHAAALSQSLQSLERWYAEPVAPAPVESEPSCAVLAE